MLNRTLLIGNLTRDPELRYTAQGTPVCNFGLAVNNRRREDEVLFVDITCWGSQAESVATHMVKGRQVLIEGRMTYRTWENQEGQKRSKHEVVADSVQFMDRAPNGNDRGSDGGAESGQTPAAVGAGGAPAEDDLPF